MNTDPDLALDGERFIPGSGGMMELEHLHRYQAARELAAMKVVLDIACGEGYGSDLLARAAVRVIGVDISPEAVAHAAATYRRANLEFRVGSCAAVPVEDASVDMVVSFETIEHHDQHEQMMSELERVLKPGGVLVISSPNKHEYSDVTGYANPFHVKELYREEFVALLRRHFRNVALYGQRTLTASAIGALDPERAAAPGAQACAGQERPVYFLALASDGELPTLRGSLFEPPAQPSASAAAQAVGASVLQVYWRGDDKGYAEEQSVRVPYVIGTETRLARVPIPAELEKLQGVRIDVSNRPLVWTMRALKVLDAAGEETWRWDGSTDVLHQPTGYFVVRSPEGNAADLVCVDGDPHFELRLPDAPLESLRQGGALEIEFCSRILLPGFQLDLGSSYRELLDRAANWELAMRRIDDRTSAMATVELVRAEIGMLRTELAAVTREAQEQKRAAADQVARYEARFTRARRSLLWPIVRRMFRLEVDDAARGR